MITFKQSEKTDSVIGYALQVGDIFCLGHEGIHYRVVEKQGDGKLIIEQVSKPPVNQWVVEPDGLGASMILDYDKMIGV